MPEPVPPPIPEDQRARIQPMVDQLLEAFRPAAAGLPVNAESALIYRVEEEPRP